MRKKIAAETNLWLQGACIILGVIGLFAYAASKFTSGKLVVIITAVGILGFLIVLSVLALQQKDAGHRFKTVILSLLSVVLGTYILLFGFVYFFQDMVANRTSAFFQPKTISAEKSQGFEAPDVLLIDLTASDGVHLHGWLVRNATAARTPLVIYFGGSGSESSEIIPLAKKLSGWSVALINYRGFGLSEGKPTHENALADALFIYDTLGERADINPDQIVAMGYSLGTGVAVYLSEQRTTIGTILVSPYEQWSLIGLKKTALYAPLKGILKPYFDSISQAPGIHTPLLCLFGTEDEFVPSENSVNLLNAWGGETRVISYPGEDHALLFHDNSSWVDISDFLKDIELHHRVVP